MMADRHQLQADKQTDKAVDEELDKLPSMPVVQLRQRYVELFRKPPPKAFGPDLLRRSIAYRIQEVADAGLSRPVQKMVDQLIQTCCAGSSRDQFWSVTGKVKLIRYDP